MRSASLRSAALSRRSASRTSASVRPTARSVSMRGHAVELALIEIDVGGDHAAIGGARARHEHREHARRGEPHEADVLERHALEPRRHREPEQARLLREQLRGHLDHRVALRVVDVVLDRAPVVLRDVAPVEQVIDEGAQPLLGGHATRRRVRLLDHARARRARPAWRGSWPRRASSGSRWEMCFEPIGAASPT